MPEGGIFFDALLSFLPEDKFSQLLKSAVHILKRGDESELAEAIIAYASIQFPELLNNLLQTLFDIKPNSGTYYECYIWRKATNENTRFLLDKITSNSTDMDYAWDCLVNIHSKSSIMDASRYHKKCKPNDTLPFNVYANLVGYDLRNGELRQLSYSSAYHITFEDGYFEDHDRPEWLSRQNHPTWHLSTQNSLQGQIGGKSESDCSCKCCNGPLHRLVEVPAGIIDVHSSLEFATCLSCLGWEHHQLFYKHDDAGIIEAQLGTLEPRTPEFPAEELKQGKISFALTPPRWQFQDWALSNSRENLNRVGGLPSWIQDADYPECPGCNQKMSFVYQLDSDLPTIDGGEWLWGSGGICYIFWCNDCRVSGYHWQCT